jgi:hypothetical protein
MRRWRTATAGVAAWLAVGAGIAGLLALALGSWSNGFAVSGVVLAVGSIGWALGPFKTPMAGSEGVLIAYQGNAERPAGVRSPDRWHLIAVPVLALVAGIVLIAVAGILAATR